MTNKTDSYKLDGGPAWRNRIIGHGEVNPEDLLANPNNWRIHPKRQQDALAGLLNQLGWIDDITVNRATGFVLDGHARVALALRKGESAVPVKFVDIAPEEEALALATLDPITNMAQTDAAKLSELMADIDTGEAALQELLAELAENAGIVPARDDADAEPQIDRAEELRQEWGTELGQLWRLPSRTAGQEHLLICGDCTDAGVVDRVMGGKRAALILTDPPYGVKMDKGFSGEGGFAGKGKPIPRRQYTDDWDSTPPSDFGLMLNGADAVILWGGNNFTDKLPRSSHWLVWDKHNTMPTYGDCELAWTNIDRKSVKKYDVEYNGLIGKEAHRYHPTQKPVKLFELVLGDYLGLGNIVADFYSGSGTTMIAAENLSRQCRAVEISPGYVAVALQRYLDAFGIRGELVAD